VSHEFVTRRSAVVRAYTGYTESGEPVARVEPAQPEPVLVISFGPTIDVDGRRFRSFAGGLGDSWARTVHAGAQAGVQVRLDPFALRALLGAPLGGEVVALEDVLGAHALELEERLAEAPTWTARFALLDDAFARRLARAPTAPADVRWAWDRLRRAAGAVRIDDLARELGWSRRHFADRFKAQLGVTPKTAARLMRFDRARQRLRAGASLADVALDCGYYDQPHMNREFRQFAGCAPSQLPFVQDEGLVAA
jgi:AraC-like DNA-binding protein